MGKKSTPKAPDYAGAAEATAAGNQENLTQQTWANRPTQNTPWGTISWDAGRTIDPSTGKPVTSWTQNFNLTPEQQAALDSEMAVQMGRSNLAEGLIGRTGQELANPMNWGALPGTGQLDASGLPQYQGNGQNGLPGVDPLKYQNLPGLDASGGYQDRFGQTFYDRSASLLQPQMERQTAALETKLRNQGLTPGTEAYDNAMSDLRTNQGEIMGRLAQDSVFAGADQQDKEFARQLAARGKYSGEQMDEWGSIMGLRGQLSDEALRGGALDLQANQQGFNQQLQGANYQNALRQQAIAEEAQRRGWSINEMNALLTGQQVSMPNMPGFNTAGMTNGPDYLAAAGAQGNFDQQSFGTNAGMFNSFMGALGSAVPL